MNTTLDIAVSPKIARSERLAIWTLVVSLGLFLASGWFRLQPKYAASTCLSNLGRIGQATNLYCQDYDGQFPAAYSNIRWPDWSAVKWCYRLEPYLHAGVTNDPGQNNLYKTYGGTAGEVSLGWADSGGSLWHCPADYTGVNISYGTNPFLAGAEDLLEDGVRMPSWRPSLTESAVPNPQDALWAGDTTKAWHEDAGRYFEVFSDWMRLRDLPKEDGTELNPDQARAWYASFLQEDDTDIKTECIRPGAYDCKGPAYWHGRTGERTGAAGMVFCDGHARLMPFGSIKPENVVVP